MRADVECFYFAHQFGVMQRGGMQIGGTVCSARRLAEKLLEIGAAYPSAVLVRLESLGDGREHDPMRDVAVLERNIPARERVA